MSDSKFYTLYKQGKLPKCFVPCPPFYDICNRGVGLVCTTKKLTTKLKEKKDKCSKCYEKYNFEDSIE